MKIKTPTEFLTFTSGTCEVWSVSGNILRNKLYTLRFGERSISMSRYIEMSMAAAAQISRAIHVQLHDGIVQAHRVVIGNIQYKIERAQHMRSTNPPATVLYLSKIGEVPKA